MKQLFFLIFIISTIACQKQEVDCDQVRSKCTYIQFSYSFCLADGEKFSWDSIQLHSDTIRFETFGCPEMLEDEFKQTQVKIQNNPATPEILKQFNQLYPSTCDCE